MQSRIQYLLVGLGLVGLLYMLARTDKGQEVTATVADAVGSAVRGIRNNNPGNIEWSAGTTWEGQVGSDGRFVIFDTMESGVRALARILGTYRNAYGLHTVTAIITRWAPPIENDTASYVLSVAGAVGVAPDAPIDTRQAGVMFRLVRAIIRHEVGAVPALLVSDATVANGIARAA